MSRWYRRYCGTVSDPKIAEAALIAECSRSVIIAVWDMILESASEANDCGRFRATSRNVAATLVEPLATIERAFAALKDLSMIENDVVSSWAKRQFISDSSTERSRKHRAEKKNNNNSNGGNESNVPDNDATLQQRCATPPDTDTDTDKKEPPNPQTGDLVVAKKSRSKLNYSEAFENFWKSYPSPEASSKAMAWKIWARLTDCERTAAAGAVPAYCAILRAKPDRPACHAATFLNQRRWETVGTSTAAKTADFWWKDKAKVASMTIDRWRAGIDKFANGKWPIEHLGFWPGHPKCIVPECLIKELHLGDKYDSAGSAKGEWKKQQDQLHGAD